MDDFEDGLKLAKTDFINSGFPISFDANFSKSIIELSGIELDVGIIEFSYYFFYCQWSSGIHDGVI